MKVKTAVEDGGVAVAEPELAKKQGRSRRLPAVPQLEKNEVKPEESQAAELSSLASEFRALATSAAPAALALRRLRWEQALILWQAGKRLNGGAAFYKWAADACQVARSTALKDIKAAAVLIARLKLDATGAVAWSTVRTQATAAIQSLAYLPALDFAADVGEREKLTDAHRKAIWSGEYEDTAKRDTLKAELSSTPPAPKNYKLGSVVRGGTSLAQRITKSLSSATTLEMIGAKTDGAEAAAKVTEALRSVTGAVVGFILITEPAKKAKGKSKGKTKAGMDTPAGAVTAPWHEEK